MAQAGKGVFAVDGLNAASLNVIVAAIQQVAYFGQFRKVTRHGVLDEIVWGTTGGRCEFLEAGFGFRLEVHKHNSQFRDALGNCQSDLGRVRATF